MKSRGEGSSPDGSVPGPDRSDPPGSADPQAPQPPLAVAMQWVSKITTVSLEMVLPAIAGGWLDRRWGTGYLMPLGLCLGLVVGMYHLILIARQGGESGRSKHSK